MTIVAHVTTCDFTHKSVSTQQQQPTDSLVKQQNDRVGRVGVETGGRFVEEQHRWIEYHLHADVDAFALATGHSAYELVSDLAG